MADMDCESLLLDEDGAEKYSEDSDYGDICNADEDALLADTDETDFVSNKIRSRIHKVAEPESEDVLDLGTQEVDLDEENARHKRNFSAMTVSSTTQAEQNLDASHEEGEERETRFKQERQISTSTKKFAHIPDSLDDVVIPNYSNNNNRNQKRFRGRGKGFYHNYQQRNKPEAKTVLINPHFKGRLNVPNNNKPNWDARQRINQNYKNHPPQYIQHHPNQVDANWNNVPNMPIQQQPQHFPPYIPQQVPQSPMYNQPPPVHMQHSQVPQQLLPTYQQSQQCFIQPLQESFYTQPPQFNHPPQFNQPTQFQQQVPRFPSGPNLYAPPNPAQMVPFNNSQFNVPQNQMMQPPFDPYSQPLFNNSVQHSNPSIQLPPNPQNKYAEMTKPNNVYQNPNFNKRKPVNSGLIRKNKKRNQVVSKNLHEVRTVQIPDTTVKDDEDEATKEYRKLIEEQKKKREQILQQKEERRRQAVLLEQTSSITEPVQTSETIVPVQQQKFVSKPVLPSHTMASRRQPVQRSLNSNVSKNTLRKVTPPIIKQINPNIKVINTKNEPMEDEDHHLSSFLTNRKILAKDETLLDTNIVLISNLADGTTAVKLRKMCVGIGDVKNLQMSPKERQATIQFNSVASAHAFFKKYQRTMLDLSMIQVTLKPIS